MTTTSNRWIIATAGHTDRDCTGRRIRLECFSYPAHKNLWLDDFAGDVRIRACDSCTRLCILGRRSVDAKKPGRGRLAMLAAALYGGGTILAGLSHNLVMLYLAYGVIGGAGAGLAYIVPVAVLIRWFPDKLGMITGLAVAGFGAGLVGIVGIISFANGSGGFCGRGSRTLSAGER
jgi:MFS transporter, OFA family, oxalate/formate antiporter